MSIISRAPQVAELCDEGRILRIEGGESRTDVGAFATKPGYQQSGAGVLSSAPAPGLYLATNVAKGPRGAL
jgi:hypothetical protein